MYITSQKCVHYVTVCPFKLFQVYALSNIFVLCKSKHTHSLHKKYHGSLEMFSQFIRNYIYLTLIPKMLCVQCTLRHGINLVCKISLLWEQKHFFHQKILWLGFNKLMMFWSILIIVILYKNIWKCPMYITSHHGMAEYYFSCIFL